MGSHHKPTIAVVGSSTASAEASTLAYEVGRCAVQRGFSIVCGGRGGVMAAACQGAQHGKTILRERPGSAELPQVIAVLPSDDKTEANSHVDIVIPTGMGYTRNALVVLSGDGVIAVEGGAGTLSEIAYAWQFNKPVAALAPSGGWAARLAGEALDDKRGDTVFRAETAAEAVEYIAGRVDRGDR